MVVIINGEIGEGLNAPEVSGDIPLDNGCHDDAQELSIDSRLHGMSQTFDSVESLNFMRGDFSVAVFGTGNYGVAFAERLLKVDDFSVVLASRRGSADPKGFSMPCKVYSYEEAAEMAKIIVLAIPVGAFSSVIERLGNKLDGKILIDVSNTPPTTVIQRLRNTVRRQSSDGSITMSNAEHLESLLDENNVEECAVIKAFNNISAYALSQPPNSTAVSKACMLSGEDAEAKKVVALMSRKMGFEVMHLGGLDAALAQEGVVHRFFESWTTAVSIAAVLTVVYFLYITLGYFVYGNADWQVFPKKTFLMVTGNVSMALLVLSFLPGPIASFWQLARGTARRPFPTFFGTWLQIRKQLGLLAFFVCIPHVIIACMGSAATEISLVYQFAPVFGTIAFTLFYIMATCSNGSVSGHFTWSEFRFVFVQVGYGTVTMTTAHLACITYYNYVTLGERMITKPSYAPPTVVFALAFCSLAVILKMIVSIPPISTAVDQIRAQQNVSILPKWMLPVRTEQRKTLNDRPNRNDDLDGPWPKKLSISKIIPTTNPLDETFSTMSPQSEEGDVNV